VRVVRSVSLLALAALLAGCGTRLPDAAFAPGAATSGAAAPTLSVGMIDSVTSPLGADAFSGPMYGARAFLDALNAGGGIDGRHVNVATCDDAGNGAGNEQCAHRLIDSDHVFAFAGNSIYDYAGASYVSAKDVPDIGGEPITNAYDQYPHLYSIYGSDEPRQGTIACTPCAFMSSTAAPKSGSAKSSCSLTTVNPSARSPRVTSDA
jgi:branched-chain amino acid transport system substrate-binding protein